MRPKPKKPKPKKAKPRSPSPSMRSKTRALSEEHHLMNLVISIV